MVDVYTPCHNCGMQTHETKDCPVGSKKHLVPIEREQHSNRPVGGFPPLQQGRRAIFVECLEADTGEVLELLALHKKVEGFDVVNANVTQQHARTSVIKISVIRIRVLEELT